MTLKYLSNNKLQKITNTLSKEAFDNPYPYPIIFVDPKEVNTARFYPCVDIPGGHEDECFIEVSKKLRKASPQTFIRCLLSCLKEYNDWWYGYEVRCALTQEDINNLIKTLDEP
ncbi:hypothetical protein [Pseudobutyrivibrio ruminis]|uniref:hypothetical protein n=1 Tax=Pseudobutyrivibrio ruminis TaxID=46206 RepID=UPI00051BA479|nr:hypothetical protein [Pseudobutyrivibrio ruminis]